MSGKKKATRATSNVFAMFEQSQVAEFKEAFGVFDQDGDGTITLKDLQAVYESLGKVGKEADLKAMLAEASGPVNFTTMLQLYGERLSGTDEESMLLNAFKLFDDKGNGVITKDNLRVLLTQEGRPEERLSETEFNQVLDEAPLKDGHIDYNAFTRLIKRGKGEDE